MGLQNMGEKEKQTVEKLHEIAFYFALKGHPFTDFQDQIKLEKLHGVKYTRAYENTSAGRDFTFFAFLSIFLEENLKKSYRWLIFLLYCAMRQQTRVTEQEVGYVTFADSEKGKSTLLFFKAVALSESQDAPGLEKAIIDTFKRNYLESVIEKIVFLLQDSALVNCGKHSG